MSGMVLKEVTVKYASDEMARRTEEMIPENLTQDIPGLLYTVNGSK